MLDENNSRQNEIKNIFSKITADDDMKERILTAMEEKEMRKTGLRRGKCIIAAAICAAVIGVTTAFAASPTGQEALSSIIAYFQNEQSTPMTSIEELAKYNEEVGASVTKDGLTLTLDNVAADDNFVHIFYTITSETPFYEDGNQYSSETWDRLLWIECGINGELAGYSNNNNKADSYFADEYTYKAMRKYNVSAESIPDNFKVELFGEMNAAFKKELPDNSLFNLVWQNKVDEITDEQKSDVWYVCADVDKSAAKVESVTRDIGVTLDSGIIIDKAVFSPFGNQVIVRTEAGGDLNQDSSDYALSLVDDFALFDENGICLDILDADASMAADGSSNNSFEFLKADLNTKKLTIVPTHYSEPKSGEEATVIDKKIGEYPMTFELKDGEVIVTDVRIYDGRVEVDYRIDGFIKYGPYFELLNDAGAEPGGNTEVHYDRVLDTEVHHDTNSYTDVYTYDARDENGRPIPVDDSVSAEAIKANFTTLRFERINGVTLDWDNAVTVDLK